MTAKQAKDATQELIPATSATELANLDAELEASAADMAAGLQDTTSKISTQNKAYKLPSGQILGPVMEAVILGYTDSSSCYEPEMYDKNNQKEPMCYADAIGTQKKAPGPSVEKPVHTDCETCPYNEFGSSTISEKGKRCKEEYRVSLVPVGTNEAMLLTIPPTARKGFAKAVRTIMRAYSHPVKAICRFQFNDDVAYSQPILVDAKPNPDYPQHYAMSKDAMDEIVRA